MPKQSLFVLLDIDNTLYEYDKTGFADGMHERMRSYVSEHLGITSDAAWELCIKYYKAYGLSLYGFHKHDGLNAKEYADFIHQCDYSRLTYDPRLVEMLGRLQFREDADDKEGNATPATLTSQGAQCSASPPRHHLYFFTNANRPHARHVLEPIGLKTVFTRPRPAQTPVNQQRKEDDAAGFDDAIEWYGFSYEDQWRLTAPDIANKPMKRAYEAIYDAIDAEIAQDEKIIRDAPTSPNAPSPVTVQHKRHALQPRRMVMVDDSPANLRAPLELGWQAVYLTQGAAPATLSDPVFTEALADGRLKVIESILQLEQALNELAEVPAS